MAERAQYGEGDDSRIPPKDGEHILTGGPSVAGCLPESSHHRDYQNCGVMPQPAQGVMFVRCCVCKVELPSAPVDQDDDAHAWWSDSYCPTHEAAMWAEVRAMDAHSIHHTMGERFISDDATALLRGLGLEVEPGGADVKTDACKLCSAPAEMVYAVDSAKDVPLDGACFGRWSPPELDALLGVKQHNQILTHPQLGLSSPGSGSLPGPDLSPGAEVSR